MLELDTIHYIYATMNVFGLLVNCVPGLGCLTSFFYISFQSSTVL